MILTTLNEMCPGLVLSFNTMINNTLKSIAITSESTDIEYLDAIQSCVSVGIFLESDKVDNFDDVYDTAKLAFNELREISNLNNDMIAFKGEVSFGRIVSTNEDNKKVPTNKYYVNLMREPKKGGSLNKVADALLSLTT